MKNKIAVYYYLRINENEIIDFSTISEFEGMEDYLTLNIFTGYHDNKEELIQTLKKLELIAPIPEDMNFFNCGYQGRQPLHII